MEESEEGRKEGPDRTGKGMGGRNEVRKGGTQEGEMERKERRKAGRKGGRTDGQTEERKG